MKKEKGDKEYTRGRERERDKRDGEGEREKGREMKGFHLKVVGPKKYWFPDVTKVRSEWWMELGYCWRWPQYRHHWGGREGREKERERTKKKKNRKEGQQGQKRGTYIVLVNLTFHLYNGRLHVVHSYPG